ncbi:MAG: hypothetical protein K2J38_00230, partial [Muribaculaceae bacterium]|nr:hypothetical protein [Muribaculaceae bacterium]
MKKLLAICLTLLLSLSALSQENNLWLWGRVKESVGKFDLTDAVVLLYDSTGAVKDSIPANQGRAYRGREIVTESNFYMKVPRRDSTYVFDVCCDGYKTETVTFPVQNIGKRERNRTIPT